ncbi:hypothetical protein EV144_106319 [Flavobacterium sp. 270]|nr:hypothetical protein EV144_106319 [Flavobacterium sp. 270]
MFWKICIEKDLDKGIKFKPDPIFLNRFNFSWKKIITSLFVTKLAT